MFLFGTQACPLKKSRIASLQFVVNSCFAKIFNIRSKTVIEECQFYFNFSAVSDQIANRAQKFLGQIRKLRQYIMYSSSPYIVIFIS